MKSLLGFLTIALFSSLSHAVITSDQEYVLNHSGTAAYKAQLGTLVNRTSNLLVAKYSFAAQGGSTVADISLLTNLADSKSTAILPANAIIKNVWLNVLTGVTSSAAATVAIKAVNAGDLLAATSKGALGVGILQGVPAGTTTTFIKLSTAKTIKATVGTTALTAGKFNVYIEYVLGD